MYNLIGTVSKQGKDTVNVNIAQVKLDAYLDVVNNKCFETRGKMYLPVRLPTHSDILTYLMILIVYPCVRFS